MSLTLRAALSGLAVGLIPSAIVLGSGLGGDWLRWLLALAPLPLGIAGGLWVGRRAGDRPSPRWPAMLYDGLRYYVICAVALAALSFALGREFPAELSALDRVFSITMLSLVAALLMALPVAPATLLAAWLLDRAMANAPDGKR